MKYLFNIKPKPFLIWITGLSASGKSTLAKKLKSRLEELNYPSYVLDGDKLRSGLNADLGYTELERRENLRRSAHVTNMFLEIGYIVIGAFISPKQSDRALVKQIVGEARYIEIFLDVELDICKMRDPKGLYEKAINGSINNFTGVSQAYEKPLAADLTFFDNFDIVNAVDAVIKLYLDK